MALETLTILILVVLMFLTIGLGYIILKQKKPESPATQAKSKQDTVIKVINQRPYRGVVSPFPIVPKGYPPMPHPPMSPPHFPPPPMSGPPHFPPPPPMKFYV